MYAAAHDFKTEWVVVKGIKDFADEMQFSSKKWKQIACVMAASVVPCEMAFGIPRNS